MKQRQTTKIMGIEKGRGDVLRLLSLFVCFLFLSVTHVNAAPLAAGTRIENKATATYLDQSNRSFTLESNAVAVIIQAVEAAVMSADRSVVRGPGQSVELPHTLKNTGNAAAAFSITAGNLAGNDFDCTGIILFLDVNGNGIVDAGEPGIAQGGLITLAPDEVANIVIWASVPGTALQGATSRMKITAVSSIQGATVSNTDTITASSLALLQLVKSASPLSPAPNDDVTFSISMTNIATFAAAPVASIEGSPVTVNGAATPLVIVRDIIPANTSFTAGSFSASGGGTLLYHRRGDAPYAYLTAEPAAVDEIAYGLPSLAGGAVATVSFKVKVNINASGNTSNIANVYFNNGTGSTSATSSNPVTLSVPDVVPRIHYFTDNTYAVPTSGNRLGNPLFVEADASRCNTDPRQTETKLIRIISLLTGDEETFTATETGENTGKFRILPNVQVRDGAANPVVHGNTTVEALKHDRLTASIDGCGSTTTVTELLIDPVGVVFDSNTNAPVAGASVSLIDVTGMGNGGSVGGLARVFAYDGVTPAPATVTTGADGVFEFPLVFSSSYRLAVTAPAGYVFPSLAPPAALAGRTIDASGSYGTSFPVNEATGAIRIDVPLDPITAGALFIRKSASRNSVEVGDFVDYSIQFKNETGVPVSTVTLVDRLPFGFTYVSGSARLDGVTLADPAGGRGPSLTFIVGSIPAGGSPVLTYRTKAGSGAIRGDGINRAQASAAGGITSNTTSARVTILPGVFTDKGIIIGKVFVDCNRDRRQGDEEPGIPGVRIYMEDGTFVITDSEGKFSFYGITPRTHVLKLDETTMPEGSELITLSNRNAGDAGSRFVDLKNGELHLADFAEGSCSPDVMTEVKKRREKGAVFVAETDKAFSSRLSLDPPQAKKNDELRSLPATGFTDPAAKTPRFDQLLPSSQDDAFLTNRSILAPIIELEDEIADMDNTFGFVDLKDGDTLPIPQLNVRVKGPAGVRFHLTVNSLKIGDSRIGKKVTTTTMEAWEFIGVNLVPGKNSIELEMVDPFGNVRGKKTIFVTAPDRLGKIVMTVPERELVADGHTPVKIKVRLTDDKDVSVTYRTQLTLETTGGRWQLDDLDPKEPGVQTFIEGGSAEFILLPPQEPGDATVTISSGVLKTERKLSFMPDLRPLIAAGVIEGVLNLRKLSPGAILGARPQDGFEKELREHTFTANDGKLTGGGRTAFFLKGKVKGEYLLTMAYDSDKDTKDRMFRDIQPDEYYPVYGDSSIRGFDAQSSGRLYVRIDKKKSYLLYGDFQTAVQSEVRQLGAYSRSLSGLKWHLEDKNTVVNAFASEDSSRQVIDEIPAQGTSGPYFIRIIDHMVNSERIEIVTRDRNQPSIVTKTTPMARFADYEIDAFSGRILFKAPVPTLDGNLNRNYIRVTYEVDQGGPKFWIYGIDGQKKFRDTFEVGGSYIRDDNPLDNYELKSANATYKLTDKTFLVGEFAQSHQDSIGSGSAKRAELRHDGDKLKGRVYASQTDATFENPSAPLGKGRIEAGTKFNYRLTNAATLTGEAIHTEDELTNGKRDGALVTLQQNVNQYVKAEIGARYSTETTAPAGASTVGISPYEYAGIRGKVNAQVPQLPKLSTYAEYEQGLTGTDQRVAALGGEYQVANKTRLYAKHQFLTSAAGEFSLNSNQQQNVTLVGIESEYMKDGNLFSEYRTRDSMSGRDTEAAIGLRNGWTVAKGVRLTTGFERVETLNGTTDNTSTAVNAGIEYTANPLWKGSARVEYRTSDTNDGFLNYMGASYKLNRNYTLLARNILSVSENKGAFGDKLQERFQAGVAYRPVDNNRWNALARYEYKYETDEPSASIDLKRFVHIFSTHLTYHPVKPLTMSGHYAVKFVNEYSNDLRSDSTAHLVCGRAIYDIRERWDVGIMASSLFSGDLRSNVYGVGAEVGYLLAANLWFSAGYNVLGFYDRDLSGENYTNPGVYIRLRFKFDETLFAGKNPGVNKTISPVAGGGGATK